MPSHFQRASLGVNRQWPSLLHVAHSNQLRLSSTQGSGSGIPTPFEGGVGFMCKDKPQHRQLQQQRQQFPLQCRTPISVGTEQCMFEEKCE
eukprot:5753145-Amphidinium_carterae.1